jgi:hypothetical protein
MRRNAAKAEFKTTKSYFQDTKARRQFFAGHDLIAYDVDQLLTFEKNFENSRLAHTTSVCVLLHCWRKARDSWLRVAEALPPGDLREEMFEELAARDAAMDQLAEQAQADLYAAVVAEEASVDG